MSRFLIGALVLTTLPSLLAVDGPHALRSIGAAPFSCLVGALGWVEVAERSSAPRRLLLAALVAAAALNARTYLGAVPNIYVPAEVKDNSVFAYLTHGSEPGSFQGSTLSAPAEPGALFVLSGSTYEDDLRALSAQLGPSPAPSVLGARFPGSTTPSFLVFRGLTPAPASP